MCSQQIQLKLSKGVKSAFKMFVIKRDGRKEQVHFDKITARIMKLSYGLNTDFCDPVSAHCFSGPPPHAMHGPVPVATRRSASPLRCTPERSNDALLSLARPPGCARTPGAAQEPEWSGRWFEFVC